MKNWLGDRDFWKRALRLALPIAFQNLLISSFALIDTMMIGHLGAKAIAGVYAAGQLSWLMNLMLFGLTSGAAVFIAQYWGIKDKDGIHRTYGLLLTSTCISAILFCLISLIFPYFFVSRFVDQTTGQEAIQYGVEYLQIAGLSYLGIAITQSLGTVLRSTEKVKIPLIGSALSLLGNIGFNYLFIHKMGMGVRGAAIATVISAWIAPIILFLVSLYERNIAITSFNRLFDWRGTFLKQYALICAPVLINEMLWAVGTVFYTAMFGNASEDFFAAIGIFKSVEGMAFSFFVGLCHACSVMVGKSVGQGNREAAQQDARRFATSMFFVSIVVGLALIACRPLILQLFNVTPVVYDYTFTIMLIYGLEIAIRNIPYVLIVGIFRAGGDTKIGLIYDVLGVWIIALPVTYLTLFVFKLPPPLCYFIMLISEDLLKSLLCLWRFKSGKWFRPVTEFGQAALEK